MNQKETKARDIFRDKSEGRIKIKLIENQNGQGTSDSAAENRHGNMFWLEFKAIDAWPKRSRTLPLHDAFRPGQIPFLKEWISWHGRGFVLLKVVDTVEWFLLWPKSAIELTEMTQQDIRDWSVADGLENIIKFLEMEV